MAQADAQADAQAQELSALTLQNNVEDLADPLTSLPPELLQKPLKFLKVDDVLEAKPVSKPMRSAARIVLTRVLLKPVKFVAEHGEQLLGAAGSAAQDRGALTPAQREWRALWDQPSSLALCREAWAVDPNETLRILFTWSSDPPLAARRDRFLSIVEPSLDGLERIVRLLEPAHRFVYAKTQLYRWWYGPRACWPRPRVDGTIEVIMGWAVDIGTPFDEPDLGSLPEQHIELVASGVFRALQSWTDAAVAADFVSAFFRRAYFDGDDLDNQAPDWGPRIPNLRLYTRSWDESKASALAAAKAADVASCELSRGWFPPPEYGVPLFRVFGYCDGPLFPEALHRVDRLLKFKQRIGTNTEEEELSPELRDEYLSLVERASRFPGEFY
jgi:hypothetical protein